LYYLKCLLANTLPDKLEQEYLRSDEKFILAFREKYTDPMPPSWMMLEVSSFGSLSVMYSNLKPGLEKRQIANAFGLADRGFASWLHSIVYLRNVCAHHSRLWNRVMSIQPLIPRKPHFEWINSNSVENNKTHYILSMLVYLMNRIKYENNVIERFKVLLNKYPNISPKAMGFPDEWKDESL
jgi:abortive infection bacteriophage resistance protein